MGALALWLTYAAAAAGVLWLAGRYAAVVPRRTAVVLAALPLVFTGRAVLTGGVYGPADLYFGTDPWKHLPAAPAFSPPRNPILSDLAFANLPWRAALREAVANGRAPLWNRFVLGGSPLVGTAQAGVFHPSTWFGLWLPLAPSWTFSCTFTLLLALVSAWAFFRDYELGVPASLVGAVGWGFSTYLVFWDGWSVGPSTATFPLLLLGLRRLARGPRPNGVALTAAALCLSVLGGHPESALHSAAAGAVYFLWELLPAGRAAAPRAVAGAAAAGVLAALLSGPQLLPLLETVPSSAEYRARREAASQSVPAGAAARRLIPDLLPFAYGIYGRSAVDGSRADGSGMPLGYAGAVLFPLAAVALGSPPRGRGRTIFLGLFVAGLAYGASAPGLLDATSRLPGFSLALNYRLVFLAGFGLAGLAALGTEALGQRGGPRRLAVAGAATLAVLVAGFLLARPVYADRGLDAAFVRREFLVETLPVLLLAAAAAAARRRPRAIAAAAVVYLVLQRWAEMAGTYPTLPADALAPALPTLEAAPLRTGEPARAVALGDAFRPNASALYTIEDVRGYESVVLARFADTFPLWCRPQAASFNRVDDPTRPFLAFLNARYAVAPPDASVPAGWREQARGRELAVFVNPRALPRAFVPRLVRRGPSGAAALASIADFGDVAVVEEGGVSEEKNGEATVVVRGIGPDLLVQVNASSRALVATSLTDWPGWVVESPGGATPVATVNHAFVGFWADAGSRVYRLRYRPRSWRAGWACFGLGLAGALFLGRLARRSRRAA